MNRDLPAWIDPEVWAEFVATRRSLGYPLTRDAARRTLLRLAEFRSFGYDANDILASAVICGNRGVFLPRHPLVRREPPDWMEVIK